MPSLADAIAAMPECSDARLFLTILARREASCWPRLEVVALSRPGPTEYREVLSVSVRGDNCPGDLWGGYSDGEFYMCFDPATGQLIEMGAGEG